MIVSRSDRPVIVRHFWSDAVIPHTVPMFYHTFLRAMTLGIYCRHDILYRVFLLWEQSCMSAPGASFGVTCCRVHSSNPGRFWLPSVRFTRRHEHTCQEHSLFRRQTTFLHVTINIACREWSKCCSVTCPWFITQRISFQFLGLS
jgi:hypothetical protein